MTLYEILTNKHISNINFEKELDIRQFEQDYEDEIDFDIY